MILNIYLYCASVHICAARQIRSTAKTQKTPSPAPPTVTTDFEVKNKGLVRSYGRPPWASKKCSTKMNLAHR